MDMVERSRHEHLLTEQEELRRSLERSRERVGVDPYDLQCVTAAAFSRDGFVLDEARGDKVGTIETYYLDPANPLFVNDAGWDDALDDLRSRPRRRGERLGDWRRDAPVRSIAFEPPVTNDGRDATGVVQCISNIVWCDGCCRDLARVSVEAVTCVGDHRAWRASTGRADGPPSVYGAGAARLHEEVIPVTAIWTEAERDRKPLRPLGESGEERTLNQLKRPSEGRTRPATAVARVQALVSKISPILCPR